MSDRDPYLSYWREAVAETLCELGLYDSFTPEQLDAFAGSMQVSHENYGMAFGHDCIPNPSIEEIKRLEKSLHDERQKVVCPECIGARTLTSHGPCHSATSQCWRCNGEGKVKP